MPRKKGQNQTSDSESPNQKPGLPEVDLKTTAQESPQSEPPPNHDAEPAAGADAAEPDWDGIRVDEPLDGEFEQVGAVDPTPPGCFTIEEFWEAFRGVHRLGSALTGVQSIAIGQADEQSARACSDAIWQTAAEVEALQFMIRKGNRWLERVSAVLLYGVVKGRMVQAELASRRAANRDGSGTAEETDQSGEGARDAA